MRVRSVGEHSNRLLQALRVSARAGAEDQRVVVLRPGVSNFAHPEHGLLEMLPFSPIRSSRWAVIR